MISGIVIKVCALPQYVGGGGSCVDSAPVIFMGQSFRSCLVAPFQANLNTFHFPFLTVCHVIPTDIEMCLLMVHGLPTSYNRCTGRYMCCLEIPENTI